MAAAGETEYSCECPTNSTETGVDLYDNSSTDLACNVGHSPACQSISILPSQVSTSTLTRSLAAENESVTAFLEEMNLNVSAFDSLGSLMSSLGGDDVELEEYFSLLFNNSQAVSLLAQSVGPDPDAQQAVIDSLETNTEVIVNTIVVN